MPVPNPDYKPDWEQIHDHHAAERERLWSEMMSLQKQDNDLWDADDQKHDSPARLEIERQKEILDRERKTHHEQCLRCLDTYQHKTVQDCAEWLFNGGFKPDNFVTTQTDIHQIDFEKFQTLKEVKEEWARVHDEKKQQDAENRYSLPIGKPDGKDIFTKTGNNEVQSQWVTFEAEELGRRRNPHLINHTHTLVTIDQREDGEWHICFMHDPDMVRGGISPTNNIEDLASAMFRRAQLMDSAAEHKRSAMPKLPAAVGSFVSGTLSQIMRIVSNTATEKQTVDPSKFHFYVHSRAEAGGYRESFCEVDLDFKNGQFSRPGWRHKDCIPEIIQSAYKKTTRIAVDSEPARPLALLG